MKQLTKFKAKVRKSSNSEFASLLVTIPSFLIKYFDIKAGDIVSINLKEIEKDKGTDNENGRDTLQ